MYNHVRGEEVFRMCDVHSTTKFVITIGWHVPVWHDARWHDTPSGFSFYLLRNVGK